MGAASLAFVPTVHTLACSVLAGVRLIDKSNNIYVPDAKYWGKQALMAVGFTALLVGTAVASHQMIDPVKLKEEKIARREEKKAAQKAEQDKHVQELKSKIENLQKKSNDIQTTHVETHSNPYAQVQFRNMPAVRTRTA